MNQAAGIGAGEVVRRRCQAFHRSEWWPLTVLTALVGRGPFGVLVGIRLREGLPLEARGSPVLLRAELFAIPFIVHHLGHPFHPRVRVLTPPDHGLHELGGGAAG